MLVDHNERDAEDQKARRALVSEGLDAIPEAARFLRISVSQVYQLMESGQLPYVKIRRSRRIPHLALVELAAKNLVVRVEG